MRNFITMTLSIMGLLLFLSLYGFYFGIRPLKIVSDITPSSYHIPYEDVSFTTRDGVRLSGWYIPSKIPNAKTIIILHGYPADKGDVLPSRIFLHNEFNLFFFDFRYFGQSSGSYTTIGKDEVNDLLAAIEYLKKRGINKVGIRGFSLGGAVAIMTSVKSPTIKAIVTESSFARLDWMANEHFHIPLINEILGELMRFWGILLLQMDIKEVSPAEAASNLTIPILLIHSKSDNVVSFKHAKELEKALSHNKKVEIIYFDSNSHGESFDGYKDKVRKFFKDHLQH